MPAKRAASPATKRRSVTADVKQEPTDTPTAGTPKCATWGRRIGGDTFMNSVSVIVMMLACPPFVAFFQYCFTHHQASISWAWPPSQALAHVQRDLPSFQQFQVAVFSGLKIYLTWVAFQVFLALYAPGKIGYGQLTPAGNVLPYNINGWSAYIISHVSFLFFSVGPVRLFAPTIIADNVWPLLIATNIYGFGLTIFAYVKAHFWPTHPQDRKFSRSVFYDIFYGIEFNPRIGDLDFKLFHNGRPGIVAWSLINMSFAFKQASEGGLTNSMVIVNLLQLFYIIDFFWNEDWYVRTIDIAHDHFGFYLAWGDSVWLPFMYTLQAQYLYYQPFTLPTWAAVAVLAQGCLGYYIFRTVNNQKDIFRANKGKCLIWGAPAEFVECSFTTSDGQTHKSQLLCSGYWGCARHFNYFGDLLLSFSFGLACGLGHIIPHFYGPYMMILLVHRTFRDDERCRGKYDNDWDKYCRRVKWKICPGIW